MEYMIVLRFIHIICGVFWAGATFYLAGFIVPAVKALGPDGAKFMGQLSRTNRLPLIMNAAGTLTVLCGLLMFEQVSGTFQPEWFLTNHGMLLTIGGVLGLLGYAIGLGVSFPTILRMNAIGKVVSASGGPLAPEQMQELQRLRKKLFTATNIIAIMLLSSVAFMSIVRYL